MSRLVRRAHKPANVRMASRIQSVDGPTRERFKAEVGSDDEIVAAPIQRVVLGGGGDGDGVQAEEEPQTRVSIYKDRLLKMIPAEAVAVYLAADGIAKATLPENSGDPIEPRSAALAWGIFVVVALVNIGYLFLSKSDKDTTNDFLLTAGIGTLAFVVWVYSIQGAAVLVSGWYWAPLASVLIILVTALAPFSAGSLDPAENT